MNTDLAPFLPQMRMKPFDHQLSGIQQLVDRPIFALFDEPGAGKTKQVIDSAQVLFFLNAIDRVIVIAPASVRGVWTEPELGELKKHLWDATPTSITEYHQRTRTWTSGPEAPRMLRFAVTNYDFLRSKERLKVISGWANQRTLLVLDESSAVKTYKAAQTKAVRVIRKKCGRIVLLNGTPIENSPGDIYSQALMMDPEILGCDSWMHFQARYAVMGGWNNRQVLRWQNLEDLRAQMAPHVLRRLKKDCLDLPEKLPPVSLTVALNESTWKIYKQMRDELVAWLSDTSVSMSVQAGVKIMRLAQLTAGFVGGVVEVEVDDLDDTQDVRQPVAVATDGRPAWLPFVVTEPEAPQRSKIAASELRDIQGIEQVGQEKLDFLMDWIDEQLEQDPGLKLFVWCRFRTELYRLKHVLEERGRLIVGAIHGAQKRGDREKTIRLLDPRTAPKEPVVVLGTLGTGARGLNLSACHTVVYMSNDFRYGTYVQSEDRFHRPGQIHNVSYFDIVATGPQGQRTVDHVLLKARASKHKLAEWTTSAWVAELKKE
jgi:SNF2 family DNA or RNA helicase